MTTYIKKTSNILWKALLVSALVFNSSCATEEAENIEITDNETPDIYLGQKKIDLKNAESSISKGTTYFIKNKNSGKVLDLRNYGNNGERNVHQWECYGTTNQQWTIENFDNYARFKCGAHGDYLEISGGSSSNEANAQVGDKSSDNRQKFTLLRRANGSTQFFIKNMKSGKVLDVANYSTSNGGNVYQWTHLSTSSTNSNQLWEFYKASDY